ncbi:MAG: hypothetical protein MJZ32_04970 [Bacteroidaceae bacterium]|nr:hypothetical protein [Bacteroidaceae bacterium]
MKVKRLLYWLYDIQENGPINCELSFSDQDCDCYTVDEIYVDEDGDVCLHSEADYCCGDLWVEDIIEQLEQFDEDSYVYFEHMDYDDDITTFDIEGGWYLDDDSDLTMDVVY